MDRQENAPLLELRDVKQRYSQGTIDLDVLTGASLNVLAGEMKALVGLGGIFSIKNKSELKNIFDYILLNDQIRKKAGMINGKYISKSIGASSRFINKLKELHS